MSKKKIPSIIKEIKKHPKHKIDFSYEKAISYSQFSNYTECPLRWNLQYVEGHKSFTSSYNSVFGTALHQTVQHYLNVMYEQSGVKANEENIFEMYEDNIRKEYRKQYEINNKQHFCTPEELAEIYDDGVEILKYLRKNKGKYFSKRGWWLLGCELPLILKTNNKNNIVFQGFIDVVLYHEPTQTFKLIDLKTSYRSWYKKQKDNEMKQFQLILYKKFFSELYNVPLNKIDIEFIILKRKLWDGSEYAQSRIQLFSPPSGKVKMNKATKLFEEFINNITDSNKKHLPKSNPNCKWCPFFQDEKCPLTS